MEEKIKKLETEIISLKEQLKAATEAEHAPRQEEGRRHNVEVGAQTKEMPIEIAVPVPMISMESGVSQLDSATKKDVLCWH